MWPNQPWTEAFQWLCRSTIAAMRAVLRLPLQTKSQIESWVCQGYPRETCGLLLGATEGGARTVEAARRARNLEVERARDRYELDPQDFLSAAHEAAGRGLEIVGVWHSHPDHPALPSETDREMAWPGWSYLIVSVGASGAADWRSWRFDGKTFQEEVIEGMSRGRGGDSEGGHMDSRLR
jgi:proteasome lid subunit RPN8/RPN11